MVKKPQKALPSPTVIQCDEAMKAHENFIKHKFLRSLNFKSSFVVFILLPLF
jgi:hypothetical protein